MKINFLKELKSHVKKALDDDEVKKDCTSTLLGNTNTTGEIIFKTSSIIYGIEWVDEVFKQVDPKLKLKWHSKNGKYVKKGVKVCTITGKCQSILSGERVALNFLQTLSGIANSIYQYKTKFKNTGNLKIQKQNGYFEFFIPRERLTSTSVRIFALWIT